MARRALYLLDKNFLMTEICVYFLSWNFVNSTFKRSNTFKIVSTLKIIANKKITGGLFEQADLFVTTNVTGSAVRRTLSHWLSDLSRAGTVF